VRSRADKVKMPNVFAQCAESLWMQNTHADMLILHLALQKNYCGAAQSAAKRRCLSGILS
jgi:hypothetical protein